MFRRNSRKDSFAPTDDAYSSPNSFAHRDQPDPSIEESGRGAILEIVITVTSALILAFLVQQFLVKPFKIPSGSMENTLRCGDRVLVDRLSWRFTSPKRGDVVVFHPPAAIGEGGQPDRNTPANIGTIPPRSSDGTREVVPASTNYIKRIVGLPGDKVEIKNHHAYINGKKLKEPYLRPLRKIDGVDQAGNWGPAVVPADSYLMLGDHRDNSADGRVFGFVPRSFLVGKTFMVYWPLSRLGALPDKDPGGEQKADPNCLENDVPEGQFLETDY